MECKKVNRSDKTSILLYQSNIHETWKMCECLLHYNKITAIINIATFEGATEVSLTIDLVASLCKTVFSLGSTSSGTIVTQMCF